MEDGPWEVLPTGYSLLALLLGPAWALVTGTLGPYLLVWTLISFAFLLGIELPEGVLSNITLFLAATSAVLFHVYIYPAKSNKWRARRLEDRGYTLVYTCRARNATEVLSMYGKSLA